MYPRLVEKRIREVMTDTRVVLLTGPRQSGKTTIAKKIAGTKIPFVSLDDPTSFVAAQHDPVGFIRDRDRVVIDEVQRVPELILSIKLSVDSDRRPGRFLLTGSTDLRILPVVADSLAGRIETVQLLPLSQAEILSGKGNFLDSLFDDLKLTIGKLRTGKELIKLVYMGGYPEVLSIPKLNGRNRWHRNYLDRIIYEDIPKLIKIERPTEIPGIMKILSEQTGTIINYSHISSEFGISPHTIQKYTRTLEAVYLLRTLNPWFTNKLRRIIKTPKHHLLDTGLLTSLGKVPIELVDQDPILFRPILESFVISEFRKIASWSDQYYDFSFYHDKDGNKVDIIIENQRQQVVGVQVSSFNTVAEKEFKPLRRLAKKCENSFIQGIILYDGKKIVKIDDQLSAVPYSCLWA